MSLIIKKSSPNKEDYKIDVYEIIKFVKNINSYILEGPVMEKLIKDRYKILFIPYNKFYLQFTIANGVDLNELKEYIPGINLIIRSTEFAENLGIIDIEDEKIFDKYEKKYLKYKLKYLRLKAKLHFR